MSTEQDNNGLEALTAGIGYNDGANKGFWRKQPRKQWGEGKGQWIEMGAKLRALFKIKGKLESITGRSGGSDGTPNGVRFLPDPGQEHLGIDSNKIYRVGTEHLEEIAAVLPEGYAQSKGAKSVDTQQGTGSVISTANIPDIADMETADVTPDDIRMINEGVNSPEGQEQADFKNSPEGQEIARLDEKTAATVQQGISAEQGREILENKRKYTFMGSDASGADNFDTPNDSLPPESLAAGYGFKETEKGSGEYETSISDGMAGTETVYTVPTTPDADGKYNVRRTEWTGLNDPSGIRQDSNDYDEGSYDSLAEAFEAHAQEDWDAAAAKDAATPTGDKALEALGYTKTGVDPNRDEWSSQGQIEAESGLPSVGISKQDDGTWELVNYETGEIFPGKNKDDAIGAFYERNRDATPEEIAAWSEEDKAKAAQEEADRQAAMAPKMTRDEFTNDLLERIQGRADLAGEDGETPVFPDKKAIDEAYDNYSSDYDMARSANEDVDYDYNQMLMDDSVADIMDDAFPLAQFKRETEMDSAQRVMDKAVNDAMNGENGYKAIGVDDLLDEVKSEDDVDLTEPVDVPGEEDLTPAEENYSTSDPEFGLTPVAKENTPAEEVQIDDFISSGGQTYKVVKNEDDGDGRTLITAVAENGVPQEFDYANYAVITKFGKPKAAPKTSKKTSRTAVPKTESPLPANAAPLDDVNDLKFGQTIYNSDGTELGKFVGFAETTMTGQAVRVNKNGTILPQNLRLDKDYYVTPREITEPAPTPTPKAAPTPAPAAPNVPQRPTPAPAPAPTVRRPSGDKTMKMAEDLKVGDFIYGMDGNADGQGSGFITNVERSGDRINVTYKSADGETRSKRFTDGREVTTDTLAGNNAPANGYKAIGGQDKSPISDEQRNALDELDGQDFIDPITDPDLRNELHDLYNALEEGYPVSAAEADDLIRRVKDYYAQRDAAKATPPATPQAAPSSPPPPPPGGPGAGGGGGGGGGNPPNRKDDGKDIERTTTSTEEMRKAKIRAEVDSEGKVTFEHLANGELALDANGNPIPVEDRASAIAQILKDYPNAKISDDGQHVVVFRRTDVDGTKVEVGISLAHRGKYLVTTKFTKPDGTTEDFLHYDLRDSYTGLHGMANGIEKMIDIITRDNPGNDKKGNERRAGRVGSPGDTSGKTLYRDRFEYFIQQGRMLTPEQTLMRYANGIAEVRNTDGVTIKQKHVPALWDAYRDKNWKAFRERFIALSAHLPLDDKTVAMVMDVMRRELKARYPHENKRAVNAAVTTATRALKKGVFADRRDIPFVDQSDNETLKPGDWVDYENNVGEISRGRVVNLDPESLGGVRSETGGSQFLDNVSVEFVDEDGNIFTVSKLTTKNMTKVDTKTEKNPTHGEYRPNLSGPALDRARGVERRKPTSKEYIAFPDLEAQRKKEKAEEDKAAPPVAGPIDDLAVGGTFYDKEGNPLGEVIHKEATIGKNGQPGFIIVYMGEDGKPHTKGVPAGEVRGPKA